MMIDRINRALESAEEATERRRKEYVQSGRKERADALKTLEGNKFCFTGKMSRVRYDIQEELAELGGTSCYSWESGITILVKKDDDWESNKVRKAESKGIPIITEDEYNELIRLVKDRTRIRRRKLRNRSTDEGDSQPEVRRLRSRRV